MTEEFQPKICFYFLNVHVINNINIFQLLLQRMRLRREGLHQLLGSHQRQKASEESRNVYEGRTLVTRSGKKL